MRGFLAGACAALVAFAGAAGATAAAPEKDTFAFPYEYVDSDTCGFAIKVDGVFTNTIIDSSAATGTGTLEFHQSNVATMIGMGTTLRVDDHYTIFVTWVDGVAVRAKHVGVLDDIRGPNGERVFFRTGQATYKVVLDPDSGFYVDGPLVTRHGVRDDFDAAAFCAAFGSSSS